MHYFFQIFLISFQYTFWVVVNGGDSEGRGYVVKYAGGRAKSSMTSASTATTSQQPSSTLFGIFFHRLSALLRVDKQHRRGELSFNRHGNNTL